MIKTPSMSINRNEIIFTLISVPYLCRRHACELWYEGLKRILTIVEDSLTFVINMEGDSHEYLIRVLEAGCQVTERTSRPKSWFVEMSHCLSLEVSGGFALSLKGFQSNDDKSENSLNHVMTRIGKREFNRLRRTWEAVLSWEQWRT